MADALSFISHPNSGFQNLEFEPGTMGRYSNTGYVLLALILERVTSETLPDYLQENIFLPAGMTNTFVISEEKHLNDAGENYALSLGNSLNVLGFNSLIYGASGVASSSNDLTRFVQSLLEYRIVSQETLDLMIQTQGSVPNIETDYGLGWLTGTGNFWHTGRITSPNDFWHSGGFDGYRTVLSINPDLNLQIIVLTNGGRETEEHMWKVVELVRKHYI
ncbi:MAG: beta-lactamase family protein [Ekhidna sp.]|nr:beta-lactamase family protein [Ekhidna sp.]